MKAFYPSRLTRYRARPSLAAGLCAVGLLLGGCTTPPPDRESELPWNTPQQWEAAPGIPGMNGGY